MSGRDSTKLRKRRKKRGRSSIPNNELRPLSLFAFLCSHFPSVTSFPRRTPPLRSQLCSPASTVLRSHLTSHQRACQLYRRRRFTDRSESKVDWETDGISRFSRVEYCGMLRFADSSASVNDSPLTTSTMLPSPRRDKVGTREWCRFRT